MNDSDHSDLAGVMICPDCFRAKGESRFLLPCRNPKCYFYAINAQFSTTMQPFRKETMEERSRHSDELRGEGSWGHKPEPLCGQQLRSSTSTGAARSSSLTSSTQEPQGKAKGRQTRDRIMSTPATGYFFFQDDTDLVEDAFLSSPMSTAADRIEASGRNLDISKCFNTVALPYTVRRLFTARRQRIQKVELHA